MLVCFGFLNSHPAVQAMSNVEFVNVDSCNTSVTSSGVKLVAHPNFDTRYIECVGLGVGVVRFCLYGTVFDADLLTCVTPTVVADESSTVTVDPTTVVTTDTIETTTEETVVQDEHQPSDQVENRFVDWFRNTPTGQLVETRIQIGCVYGELDVSSGVCICVPGYTGVGCDQAVVGNGTVSAQVQQGVFDLGQYKLDRNLTDAGYEVTLGDLMGQLWSEVDPAQVFLHDFDYSTVLNGSNATSIAHKLYVYVADDYQKFETRFMYYVQLLDALVGLLANTSVKQEAVDFVNEWTVANNLTDTEKYTGGRAIVCQSIVSRVEDSLNVTRLAAERLFESLNDSTVYNETVAECYVNVLSSTTLNVWNTVVEAGFWKVTTSLTGVDGHKFLMDRPTSFRKGQFDVDNLTVSSYRVSACSTMNLLVPVEVNVRL